MKILLLTSYDVTEPFELNKCKNRFHLYAMSTYNYLKTYDTIEVLLDTSCPPGKSHHYKAKIDCLAKCQVDHTILVDERGFQSRHTEYINGLRKITKGKIYSIGASGIHQGGEDGIFYTRSCIINSPFCLNYPVDDKIIKPTKTNQYLTFLVSAQSFSYIPYYVLKDTHSKKLCDQSYLSKEHVNLMKKFDDNTDDTIEAVNKFARKNNDEHLIILKKLDYRGLTVSDNVSTVEKHVIVENMEHYYTVLTSADVFFVTNRDVDTLVLYDLAMANTLIVSLAGIIDKKIIEELEIIEYSNKIPWSEIFLKLPTFNIRDKLINNGHSWETAIDHIFSMLVINKDTGELLQPEQKQKLIVTQEKMLRRAPKTQWELKHACMIKEQKKIEEEEENEKKKPVKKMRVLQNFRT
jgi:hypothetical protein